MTILLPDPNIVNEEQIILDAEKILAESASNISARSEAIDQVVEMLCQLDEGTRELYIDELCKKFKIKKKVFQAKIKTAIKSKPIETFHLSAELDIPAGVDYNEALRKGYFTHNNAYYFITKEGTFRASNFCIKPILHIYSKTDNKRIIEVENEYGDKKLLDLPSKNMVSTDLFQQSVFNEGNFIFFGTKVHHYRILSNIARKFPIANELRTLGFQREGFYAFANGIFNGAWHQVSEIGTTNHNGSMYFSPAFSSIYANVREDDDEYENDRFFVYKESSICFADWSKLLLEVYGEKARIAISFLIASILRSYIYDIYKLFPHLFLFGEKQSGKSQLAWSLSNVLFDQMPAFNLNSGTQVGFFRRLSRVKDGICWFDEYTNDILEPRFQALKSAYDGMGHEKGKLSRDSRTEITKVNSACVISGQYLPTRDDNSLQTRSILLNFEKTNYTKAQITFFDKLKVHESQGLSSMVTEILRIKPIIHDNFVKTFAQVFDYLKNTMAAKNKEYDDRILRNYCCILTPVKIILDQQLINLGFNYNDLQKQAMEMINDQTIQISSSEAVSTFWTMIAFMFESKPPLISEGEDFKIDIKKSSVNLRDKHDKPVEIVFDDEPIKLIYFRFTKIHPLYMESHRKQYGKNGLDIMSLLHYIKHHKAYLGYSSSTRFDSQVTSAYVFKYDDLKISLQRDPLPTMSDDIPY